MGLTVVGGDRESTSRKRREGYLDYLRGGRPERGPPEESPLSDLRGRKCLKISIIAGFQSPHAIFLSLAFDLSHASPLERPPTLRGRVRGFVLHKTGDSGGKECTRDSTG